MGIFVVTYPQNGWDCVRSVYEADSEEDVWQSLYEDSESDEYYKEWKMEAEDNLVVHEKYEIIKLN